MVFDLSHGILKSQVAMKPHSTLAVLQLQYLNFQGFYDAI